jgi:predicted RNA-binding Zn ribbon-like protein
MDLGLIERFLNTVDQRTFSVHGENHSPHDQLTSPENLATWLAVEGLAAEGLDPGALNAAVSLRNALRQALLEGTDAQATQALAAFPLRLVTDASGQLRITAASGVPGLDAIIETVAVSTAAGNWHRLKLCASEDCRWAFYDTSRSGGGRWCSMEVCGNRHKTRAYRRRQNG